MENDYSSFIEKNDDGSVKAVDEAKMTSYIDSLVSKGVESYKAKVAKEQELAKLSDQEKVAQQLKEVEIAKSEWEKTMKAQKRDIVVEKAKAKLGDNFSDEEKVLYTKFLNDDEKESMKYIDSVIAERNKFLEGKTKSIIEGLQSQQPTSTTSSNTQSERNQTKPVGKTAQEIKDLFK